MLLKFKVSKYSLHKISEFSPLCLQVPLLCSINVCHKLTNPLPFLQDVIYAWSINICTTPGHRVALAQDVGQDMMCYWDEESVRQETNFCRSFSSGPLEGSIEKGANDVPTMACKRPRRLALAAIIHMKSKWYEHLGR